MINNNGDHSERQRNVRVTEGASVYCHQRAETVMNDLITQRVLK